MSDIDQKSTDRARRREERQAGKQHMRSWFGGAPLGGLILLFIGAVLLAQNMGVHLPDHWWAALILIPAGGSLVNAIRQYRADGRFSNRVLGSAAAGVIFLVITCWLYFSADLSILWPLILMLIGAAVMARSMFGR